MGFIDGILRVLTIAFDYPGIYLGAVYGLLIVIIGYVLEFWSGRKQIASIVMWWIASLCYLVGIIATITHEIVVASTSNGTVISTSSHAFETGLALLSQALFNAFGLPASFQLIFSDPNHPDFVFGILMLIFGLLIGIVGLIAILQIKKNSKWSFILMALSILVLIIGIYNALAYGAILNNYNFTYLLSSGLLFICAWSLRKWQITA